MSGLLLSYRYLSGVGRREGRSLEALFNSRAPSCCPTLQGAGTQAGAGSGEWVGGESAPPGGQTWVGAQL